MFFRKRPNIKTLSDEDLIAEFKASGDNVYIGELFDRYTHLVYLVCMKYLKNAEEAEDLSMQVFEKLLRDLPRYEVRNFKPWLHTVTKNQCLIFLEKQKRKRQRTGEFEEKERQRVESERESHLNNEREDKETQLVQMEQALQLLNEQQRRCLDLFYLQQKSYQEVSDVTGYTMKQVKSYIQNGKRNLKKHMETASFSSPPIDGLHE